MVKSSTQIQITFPGIIELPGSFSGSSNSPSPHRGPDPNEVNDLWKLHAHPTIECHLQFSSRTRPKHWELRVPPPTRHEQPRLQTTLHLIRWRVQTLFAAVTKGAFVRLAIVWAILTSNPILVFNPWKQSINNNKKNRSDSGAALCKWIKSWQATLYAVDTHSDLIGIAREFLS